MIYASLTINCDVSIVEQEDGFHFYVLGNLHKNDFIVPNRHEAINECLWLRTQGIDIPNYVIEKLRNEK